MKPLNVLPKFENHFANQTVRFQVQLEADGYFFAQEVFEFAIAASRASWYQLILQIRLQKRLLGFAKTRYSAHKLCRLRILTDAK